MAMVHSLLSVDGYGPLAEAIQTLSSMVPFRRPFVPLLPTPLISGALTRATAITTSSFSSLEHPRLQAFIDVEGVRMASLVHGTLSSRATHRFREHKCSMSSRWRRGKEMWEGEKYRHVVPTAYFFYISLTCGSHI